MIILLLRPFFILSRVPEEFTVRAVSRGYAARRSLIMNAVFAARSSHLVCRVSESLPTISSLSSFSLRFVVRINATNKASRGRNEERAGPQVLRESILAVAPIDGKQGN